MKQLDICIGQPAFRVGRPGALASCRKAFQLLDQAVMKEQCKRHGSALQVHISRDFLIMVLIVFKGRDQPFGKIVREN